MPVSTRALILLRLVGQALLRPGLYGPALRAAWRFRARGWYRRPPFLPLPPGEYLLWRMETAYGSPHAPPTARELGRYLRWAERMRDNHKPGKLREW